MIGLGVNLGACSTCPEGIPYTKVPYTLERTTGAGVAFYSDHCPAENMRQLEPAAGDLQTLKMDKIFWQQQHKNRI